MPGPLDREKNYIEKKTGGAAAATPSPSRSIPVPGADKNVRYEVRGGVTIAIPVGEALPLPVPEPGPTFRIPPPPPRRPEEVIVPPLPPASVEGDGASALWNALPRHVQILASLVGQEDEPSGERTFEETRPQLLARLLDPALTLEETARLLDVCPATVRRYTNRGQLPHTRTIGQQRRFRLSEVLAFLELRADRAGDD
jgi:excisionase family DNA binding protein